MTFAHVGGMPVEELAPLALASGGLLAGALRQHATHTFRETLRRLRGERQP